MTDDVKVYRNRDNSAMVVCPHCESARRVDVGKIRKCGHRVRLRCNCGGVFDAFVECRQAYRKVTRLVGFYNKAGVLEERGEMIVRNISLTGIGFVTLEAHNLKKDDEVTVEFTLDDERHSRIVKNFIVRRITKNNYVGCESYKPAHADEAPDQADKAIGFYLMP